MASTALSWFFGDVVAVAMAGGLLDRTFSGDGARAWVVGDRDQRQHASSSTSPQPSPAPRHARARNVTSSRVNTDALADWLRTRADRTPNRFLFGLAGAPGSGKSTIAQHLAAELGAVVVPMDGFHLPNSELDRRNLRPVKGAPETFDAHRFTDAVRALRRADVDVWLPDFDRASDEPREDRVRVPASASIVIVEGNYLLLRSAPWSGLREIFDAVAHLEIDADVRIDRLVERHVRFGKPRDAAVHFVLSSDEPNAALVEAVSHRAHLTVVAGS